jgi:predicted transcriptional regulator
MVSERAERSAQATSIRVDAEMVAQLKLLAALRGTTSRSLVEKALREWWQRQPERERLEQLVPKN